MARLDSYTGAGRDWLAARTRPAADALRALASLLGGKAGIPMRARRVRHRPRWQILALVVFAASMHANAAPASAETAKLIPYGSRAGQELTVKSRKGINSASAVIEIEHTRANAKAFCVDYRLDETDGCVDDVLKSLQFAKTIHGDCDTMGFYTASGTRYTFAGRNTAKDAEHPYRIINWDTRKEPQTWGEFYVAEQIFAALCPVKYIDHGGRLDRDGNVSVTEVAGNQNSPATSNGLGDAFRQIGPQGEVVHHLTCQFSISQLSGQLTPRNRDENAIIQISVGADGSAFVNGNRLQPVRMDPPSGSPRVVAAIYHAREVNDAMGVTGKGAPPMAGLSAEDRRALEFGLGVVRSQRDAYFGNRFMHISFNDGAVRFANIGDNGAVSNVQQATCF